MSTSKDELRTEFHRLINDKLGADDHYISFLENTLLSLADAYVATEVLKELKGLIDNGYNKTSVVFGADNAKIQRRIAFWEGKKQ